MKSKIYLFLCLMLGFGVAQAQVICSKPMANQVFQQRLFQLTNSFDGTQRFQMANAMLNGNCLSSGQIYQVALQLQSDYDKFEFAKKAYPVCTDQFNFYDVYDAFSSFSMVFRLHDYIDMQTSPTPVTPVPPVVSTPTLLFPDWPYPDARQYLGNTGCLYPVANAEFEAFALEMKQSKISEQAKLEAIRAKIMGGCFSVEQTMKLASILSLENSRLQLFRGVHTKLYDIQNAEFYKYVFTAGVNQTEFMNFLKSLTTPQPPVNTTPVCSVSTADYNQVVATIKKENFENTRVNVARQILTAKKCFTAVQIRDLLKEFNFDSNRLSLAKFAYDYCIDKDNYYLVGDALTFSSSKDDLIRYIKTK